MKMKDKKSSQIEAKLRHREQLKKSRRTSPSFERQDPVLNEYPLILIVCEGKNTETSYFKQFRLSSAKITTVGEGYNTISLVKRAKQLSEENEYDQVWCVFDKDNFTDNDFNSAIIFANSIGFNVAYSNQAFEYWLILHFLDHQGGSMLRSDYSDKINSLIKPYNVFYDGNGSKLINENFFELLDGIDERTGEKRVELAIKRAERNYNEFPHHNPAVEESSTTVFKLVQKILEYL
jgi:hypothetical protein